MSSSGCGSLQFFFFFFCARLAFEAIIGRCLQCRHERELLLRVITFPEGIPPRETIGSEKNLQGPHCGMSIHPQGLEAGRGLLIF